MATLCECGSKATCGAVDEVTTQVMAATSQFMVFVQ